MRERPDQGFFWWALDAGWSDHLYTRDIVYDYREEGGSNTAAERIRMDNYRLPSFPPLRVSISARSVYGRPSNTMP